MCAIKYFFLLSNPEKQIGVKRRMFTGYSLFVHEINIGIMKWNAKLASGTVHFYSCRINVCSHWGISF